jgi:hypothetical protein
MGPGSWPRGLLFFFWPGIGREVTGPGADSPGTTQWRLRAHRQWQAPQAPGRGPGAMLGRNGRRRSHGLGGREGPLEVQSAAVHGCSLPLSSGPPGTRGRRPAGGQQPCAQPDPGDRTSACLRGSCQCQAQVVALWLLADPRPTPPWSPFQVPADSIRPVGGFPAPDEAAASSTTRRTSLISDNRRLLLDHAADHDRRVLVTGRDDEAARARGAEHADSESKRPASERRM